MFSIKLLDNVINTIGKYYRVLPILLTIAYGLIFIGVIYINPDYLYKFKTSMQLIVCVFLIYRFHPYRKHVLGEYDARIIFSSAMFLLVNIGAVAIANKLITPIDDALNLIDIPIDEITNVTELL
jgi:hypothetical protein|tara:strand:- start:364 stop:738 length:375 start_codon:yes stop_codon:yes gene_type:complete